jgi:hypothetical protein
VEGLHPDGCRWKWVPRTHFHTCWRSDPPRDGIVERVDTSLEGGTLPLETESGVEPRGDWKRCHVSQVVQLGVAAKHVTQSTRPVVAPSREGCDTWHRSTTLSRGVSAKITCPFRW